MVRLVNILIMMTAMMLGLSGLPQAHGAAAPLAAQGKNRAEIQIDRKAYSQFQDVTYMLNTLVKSENRVLLPEPEPVTFGSLPPASSFSGQIDQPWLYRLRDKLAFALGPLNLKDIKITGWSLNLYNNAGEEVRRLSGAGPPPPAFYWDGMDQQYHPVAIGQDYYPEIILQDNQARSVRLPQTKINLDQFIWREKRYIKAGLLMDYLFEDGRATLTESGRAFLREISFILAGENVILLNITAKGQDAALMKKRAGLLGNYFKQKNLAIKKVQVDDAGQSVRDVVYFLAIKL